MDALMAAFVAALILHTTDRTAWLVAMLSERFERPRAVLLGAAMALAAGNGLAAAAGAWIGPQMTPAAQTLFLALALLSAGFSALFTPKQPDTLKGWRIGATSTSLVGVGIVALGDRTQFVTLALAERTPAPALAAIGATLGALVAIGCAALGGPSLRDRLPLGGLRVATAALFLATGAIVAVSALALI